MSTKLADAASKKSDDYSDIRKIVDDALGMKKFEEKTI
tara:strand:- start:436 stop:549 length:114 start_codon:yes stop_codon:yes gene_type:complete